MTTIKLIFWCCFSAEFHSRHDFVSPRAASFYNFCTICPGKWQKYWPDQNDQMITDDWEWNVPYLTVLASTALVGSSSPHIARQQLQYPPLLLGEWTTAERSGHYPLRYDKVKLDTEWKDWWSGQAMLYRGGANVKKVYKLNEIAKIYL